MAFLKNSKKYCQLSKRSSTKGVLYRRVYFAMFTFGFYLLISLCSIKGNSLNHEVPIQVLSSSAISLTLASPYSQYQISDLGQTPEAFLWKPTLDSIFFSNKQTLWIRYKLINSSSITQTYYFNGKNLDFYELEIIGKNSKRSVKNGLHYFNNAFSILQFMQIDQVPILPNDTVDVSLKVNFYKPLFGKSKTKLLKINTIYTGGSEKLNKYQQKYWEGNIYELQIRSIVLGALLIITSFCCFLLLKNRKNKLIKYYFIYIITALLFTLLASRSYTYAGQFFSRWPLAKIYGSELCLWIGLAAYFRFIPELLSLQKKNPSLYQLANKSSILLAIVGFGVFIYLLLTHNTSFYEQFYFYSRIPLLLFYCYFLFKINTEHKTKELRYVILANFMLLGIGITAWVKKMAFSDVPWPGIFNHIFTVPSAVLAEIIVFSLAIANKINSDQRLQNTLTNQLVQTEMQVLRSQMNPHFLFNCINSIKFYVVKNEPEQASIYLNKFSNLIRKFLNNSQFEYISLEDEIQTISLYLEMEKLRFGDKMEYNIDIHSALEPSFLKVPSMLIQPFLENAIWHGLMQKTDKDGFLKLIVSEWKEDLIKITIEDNGIGRKMAAQLKSKILNKNKSMGLELTLARVKHLNEVNDLGIIINTTDLINNEGIGIGTKVEIILKAIHLNE